MIAFSSLSRICNLRYTGEGKVSKKKSFYWWLLFNCRYTCGDSLKLCEVISSPSTFLLVLGIEFRSWNVGGQCFTHWAVLMTLLSIAACVYSWLIQGFFTVSGMTSMLLGEGTDVLLSTKYWSTEMWGVGVWHLVLAEVGSEVGQAVSPPLH